MKKWSKVLSLTLAASLLATTVLTGCKNDGDGSSGSSDTAKGDTMTKLVWYGFGNQPQRLDEVNAKLNDLLKKDNLEVEMKFVAGDYTEKTQTLINSQEDIDIIFTCSWANPYIDNVRKKAFAELNTLLENNEYGKKLYETVDERFWKGSAVNGKNYAVPANKELPEAPRWVVQKDLAEKYGMVADGYKGGNVSTLEKYLKAAKDDGRSGLQNFPCAQYLHARNSLFEEVVSNIIGVKVTDKDAKAVYMYDDEETIMEINTMKKYYDAGYINEDAPTLKEAPAKDKFVASDHYSPFAENLWKTSRGAEVVTYERYQPMVKTNSTTGSMQAILSYSKKQEAAIKFLSILNTNKDVRTMVAFGEEGKDYDLVDGKIKQKDGQYSVANFSVGNLYILPVMDGDPDNKWEVFQEFNDSAITSPILGFFLDKTPIENEIVALDSVFKEYDAQLWTGTVKDPAATLKEMKGKMESAGLQKVLDEINKQITDWKAATK